MEKRRANGDLNPATVEKHDNSDRAVPPPMKQKSCQKGRKVTPHEAEIMTLQAGKEDSQRNEERKKMTPTAGSDVNTQTS